eukprot:5750118-Heterocapsa_arctica.AAC.1
MSGPRSHWRRVSSSGVQSNARYSAGGFQPCFCCVVREPHASCPGVAAVPPGPGGGADPPFR